MRALIIFLLLCSMSLAQSSFRIESGTSIVSAGDPFITLHNSDLYNGTSSGDFTDGTIWSFTGNINQYVLGTSITKFYGLRLNNYTGFSLSGNTTITNRLDMVDGNINCGSYTLEVGESVSNTGQINWTTGTVIGPVKRWFATSTNSTQSSGIFPIGNDATNRNVIINYTQAPTEGGYIVAEYKSGIPVMTNNYNGLPLWASDGQVVQNYEDQGYFEITPDSYSSSLNSKQYTLTMRGNGLTTVNDRSTIRLVKSPGPSHTIWVAAGNHASINGTSNSDFTVTSNGVSGFSWFNFGGQNNNPLPVELLYFDGYAYLTFNSLRWSTASEHNSDYFEIEHSENGEDWKTVGIKNSTGNSNQKIDYNYTVSFERLIINYYRLKQVDNDGMYKYYGPIALDNRIASKKVVKYVNLLGQEVSFDTKGLIFEVYEDGTNRKIIR